MAYDNEFLREFTPVFCGILKALGISIGQAELEILDENAEEYSHFEVTELLDVLNQIAFELNFLTIYTERPAYFEAFKETLYEENGLLVNLFDKSRIIGNIGNNSNRYAADNAIRRRILLDFERQGECWKQFICARYYYIPVYKKCWCYKRSTKDCRENTGNLDILVPIGYNTLTVKSVCYEKKRSCLDRFEAAFYA